MTFCVWLLNVVPIPVDAVLLDLEVKLAGKTLRGCVIERKAAQEKYEDAVTSGDSAVLLEQKGGRALHHESR